ncbi:hypothetical protein GCM10027299_39890 [Larkinella ripae]
MKTLLTVFWLGCGGLLTSTAFGGTVIKMATDTVIRSRFESLARQLRLKKPALEEGEYEVRMWVKEELRYGDFQVLYVLTKEHNKLKTTRYSLEYDKHKFTGFKKQVINTKEDQAIWKKLIANDITMLPDMVSLPVFRPYKPEPGDTSRRVDVSSGGEVTITMKKRPERGFLLIADGTSYHFEILSKKYYHHYTYSNPLQYSKHYTDTVELQKVSAIIDEIIRIF